MDFWYYDGMDLSFAVVFILAKHKHFAGRYSYFVGHWIVLLMRWCVCVG